MSRTAQRRVFEGKGVEQVVLRNMERTEDRICPTALLFITVWGMAAAASLRNWLEVQNLRPHPRPSDSESAF